MVLRSGETFGGRSGPHRYSPRPWTPRVQTSDAWQSDDERERLGRVARQPNDIERAFIRLVDALFERIANQARALAKRQRRELEAASTKTQDAELDDDTRGQLDSIGRAGQLTKGQARALVEQVGKFNQEALRDSLRLDVPEINARTARKLATDALSTINGIGPQTVAYLRPVVERAARGGLRGSEFEAELERRLGVSKLRARRLAESQVVQVNSTVTRERHKALGIEEYVWRIVRDGNARWWHARLDGTRQRYDKPPQGGGAGPKDHGHPGSANGRACRCQGIPVIPARPKRQAPPAAPVRRARPQRQNPVDVAIPVTKPRVATPARASTQPKKPQAKPLPQPARVVSALGGVLKGEYLRDGMRSLDPVRAAYAGVSPAQAQLIATGKRPVQPSQWGTGLLPPIRVAVERDKNGKEHVAIVDGRHRATGAREAGATHIRAIVARAVQRANGKWVDLPETIQIVKL